NGVVLGHRFRAGEPWELSTDVYAGGFELLEFAVGQTSATSLPSYMVSRVESKNVLGTRLWLATPLEGLRIGVSGLRKEEYGGANPMRDLGRVVTQAVGSVDGHFEHMTLRA